VGYEYFWWGTVELRCAGNVKSGGQECPLDTIRGEIKIEIEIEIKSGGRGHPPYTIKIKTKIITA
jgi:hypothetical protein